MLFQIVLAALMAVAGLLLALGLDERVSALAAGLLLGGLGVLLISVTGVAIGIAQSLAGIAAAGIVGLDLTHNKKQRTVENQSADTGLLFRLLVNLMTVALAFGLSQTVSLQAPAPLSFAWYSMVVLSLVMLMTERSLARTGYGILLLGAAGPAFYLIVSSEHSLEVTVAGAVVTITLGFLLPALNSCMVGGTPTRPMPKESAG